MTETASSGSNKVAAGIGLSRIAGVVREIFIAAVLGAGADAFRFAMQIPNLIQNLLGEGSLSAAFVPVYAGALQRAEEDPDGPDGREARQLAGSVLGFGLAVVALLVAVVVLLTRPLVQVVTLGAVKGRPSRSHGGTHTNHSGRCWCVGDGGLVSWSPERPPRIPSFLCSPSRLESRSDRRSCRSLVLAG